MFLKELQTVHLPQAKASTKECDGSCLLASLMHLIQLRPLTLSSHAHSSYPATPTHLIQLRPLTLSSYVHPTSSSYVHPTSSSYAHSPHPATPLHLIQLRPLTSPSMLEYRILNTS